jgi:uncharacterized protein
MHTVTSKTLLLKELKTRRKEIKSYGVKQLRLFGSFAKDTNITSDSDIDFLVEFELGEKTYDNFMNLSFYLEDLLGRKVELVTPQALSKYVGPYIIKEAEDVFF